MKKLGFLFIVLLYSLSVLAQHPITLSQNSIDFGLVIDNSPASQVITFSNSSNQNITVDSILFFRNWNRNSFRVSDSVFTIPANGSKQITVFFEPKHNMFHNSELIFLNNSKSGPIRLDVRGQGRYALSYYNSSENLEGEQLKAALKTRINQGYIQLGYTGTNNARIRMFETIDNWRVNGREPNSTVNKCECVYTGRIITGYPINTGTLNNAPYSMNTEHTWPQSLGATDEPMQSDLHHLYPADGATNTIRSNDPFANLSTFTWTQGGSRSNGSSFEPRNEHKSNVAASLFYFGLKYNGVANVSISWLTPQESTLRGWLNNFPPNAIARKRNIDINAAQNNRNPFLDYPQFMDRISTISGTATVSITKSLMLPELNADFGVVNVGDTKQYQVMVVNNGRDSVQLSNAVVSGTGFSLAGTFPTTWLKSGEALAIPVSFSPASAGSMAGTLTFNTDITAFPSYTVALNANGATSVIDPGFKFQQLDVFPNPAVNYISGQRVPVVFVTANEALSSQPSGLEVVNALGQRISTRTQMIDNYKIAVDVQSLPAGVYTLRFLDSASKTAYTAKLLLR